MERNEVFFVFDYQVTEKTSEILGKITMRELSHHKGLVFWRRGEMTVLEDES